MFPAFMVDTAAGDRPWPATCPCASSTSVSVARSACAGGSSIGRSVMRTVTGLTAATEISTGLPATRISASVCSAPLPASAIPAVAFPNVLNASRLDMKWVMFVPGVLFLGALSLRIGVEFLGFAFGYSQTLPVISPNGFGDVDDLTDMIGGVRNGSQ